MAELAAAHHGSLDDYGVRGHPSWLDVEWRSHLRTVEVNGAPVSLVDIGAGPAMIFVHGMDGDWQNWLENLPHFAATHRCIAMDVPSFGFSPRAPGDYSVPALAGSIAMVMDSLEIAAAVAVGNSLGGSIATELALRFPERVDRLVLVAPALLWSTNARAQQQLRLAMVGGSGLSWVSSLLARGFRRPRARAASLAKAVAHPLKLSLETAYELTRSGPAHGRLVERLRLLYDYDLVPRLGELSCPTLIVWGDQDQLLPVSQSAELARLMPTARLEIFEDTGHLPMVERPLRFNSLVDDFLVGEPGATTPGSSGNGDSTL